MDQYLKDWIEQAKKNEKVKKLLAMPDWEFCIVFRDGLGDECSGTTHNGVYYSEHVIAGAYRVKWPDADPLF